MGRDLAVIAPFVNLPPPEPSLSSAHRNASLSAVWLLGRSLALSHVDFVSSKRPSCLSTLRPVSAYGQCSNWDIERRKRLIGIAHSEPEWLIWDVAASQADRANLMQNRCGIRSFLRQNGLQDMLTIVLVYCRFGASRTRQRAIMRKNGAGPGKGCRPRPVNSIGGPTFAVCSLRRSACQETAPARRRRFRPA